MRSAEVSSLECGGYLDSLTRKKIVLKTKIYKLYSLNCQRAADKPDES